METGTETEWLDSLGERDFAGAVYTIAVPEEGAIPMLNHQCGEMTGETMNDAQYQRDEQIMERYNCTVFYPENLSSDAFKNGVIAGDATCDVFVNSLMSTNIGSLTMAGVTRNLLEVAGLHLNREWWSTLMYENLQYNGKMFYTSGDLAVASYIGPACIYLNLQLADNYALDTDALYTKVYDGQWTLDGFYDLYNGLDTDLNGDGKMHCLDDFYGVVTEYNNLTSALLLTSAGVRLCEVDENGKMQVNLGTDDVVDVVEKMQLYFNKIENNNDNTLLYDQTFKNGRALFAVHYTESTIRRFRDMEDDYVILPMPKYTELQETYISYINPWVNGFVCMPVVLEDEERAGFLTDAMAYMSHEIVRPAMYDMTLKGKAARNEDCVNMIDIVFSTTYLDFNGIYEFGGSMQIVNDTMFFDKPYASAYAAAESRIQTALDEFMTIFAD